MEKLNQVSEKIEVKNSKKNKNLMGQIQLEEEFQGLNALHSIFKRLIHSAARYIPMFPSWRVVIHRIRGVNIGKNVYIGPNVFIDNTYPERVTIEDFVTIVSCATIIAHNFIPVHFEKILSKNIPKESNTVILKKGCYIQAQCIIFPGVCIGEYSIISAGSIVTQDIPPYSLAIGSPARVIKQFSQEDILI